MSVLIRAFNPPQQLSPYVVCFWEGDFNLTQSPLLTQRVVPNGYVEIIIHVTARHCSLFKGRGWSRSPAYAIVGLHTEPYVVKFAEHVQVFGIRLKPDGIFSLFRIPSSHFNATYEDMEGALGVEFRKFCNRLSEATTSETKVALASDFLVRSLQQNSIGLNYVNRAAEIIRNRSGAIVMDELADEVCISRRQLEREFSNKLGITPKQYIRLSRVNEVYRRLALQQELNLMDVSYHCGYADQAHFIREFKGFTGYAPTVFVKNRQEFIVNPG
jgi:AraC-like DNA-binding protein